MHFLEKNSGADLLLSGSVLRNDLEPGSNQVFDYVLLLYVTRIVGRRQLGAQSRPDPIPTRPAPIKKGRPEGRPKFMKGLGAIP